MTAESYAAIVAGVRAGFKARLVAGRDLLYGPAVAVGVAEEDERAPVELLDLADIYPPLHELLPRCRHVRDDNLQALHRARWRI